MSRTLLIALATVGSAALLAGAFAFQYLGDMAPCHLCLLQRYPHAAAVLIGVVALLLPRVLPRLLPLAGAAATLTTAAYGAYHTGVERHWWPGPNTCTSGGSISTMDAKDLTAQLLNTSLVQCDVVAWSMMGLSMASWNMVAALLLTVLWVRAAQIA